MHHKILAIWACLLAFLCVTTSPYAIEKKEPPEILATVNGEPVRYSEIKEAVEGTVREWERRSGKKADDEVVSEIRRVVLSNSIRDVIIRQECQKYMVEVTNEELDRELLKQMVEFGGKKKFEENLAANNLSLDVIKTKLWSAVAAKKLVNEVIASRIEVTDDEVKKFYEASKARFYTPPTAELSHIVIEVPKDATAEQIDKAKKNAELVLKKLRDGADFAEMAQEYSDDPNKMEGGKIGMLQPGRMPPEFDKAAFALKEGEISDVVKTKYGYHIIKAGKVSPENTVPLEDAKEGITILLKKTKIEMAEKGYMEQLLRSAKIQSFI
ncbi:MAG: peptidylprolyl isomerase [Deltaproteobacteria bacterium]|nr:peptidylprolyl isomerase [Deltaproteobacteria bacterium]